MTPFGVYIRLYRLGPIMHSERSGLLLHRLKPPPRPSTSFIRYHKFSRNKDKQINKWITKTEALLNFYLLACVCLCIHMLRWCCISHIKPMEGIHIFWCCLPTCPSSISTATNLVSFKSDGGSRSRSTEYEGRREKEGEASRESEASRETEASSTDEGLAE